LSITYVAIISTYVAKWGKIRIFCPVFRKGHEIDKEIMKEDAIVRQISFPSTTWEQANQLEST